MTLRSSSLLAGAIALSAFSVSSQAVTTVAFDNISAVQTGVPGAAITSTSSSPNTFMGGAYTLAAGTTSITGFDLYPVNVTGTTFTNLKLNLYVWGSVNTGAVSAAAPAFSNLLGTYSFTAAGTYSSGFYYAFESASPGVTPGISLGAPLAVGGSTIGLTLNIQGSTDGGTTYNSVQSLSSMISYGAPASVGSMPFNGYYRNGNGEVNGNFTSGVRSLGFTNQGVAVRIYGNVSAVPEPATWVMMALGVAALLMSRRRVR